MKVAVSSMGNDLNAQVDPRFGRCHYLIIVDTDTMEFESIENQNAMAAGGAGIQTGQLVAGKNVEAVITGHCGPNAFTTLNAADIKVYTYAGTINDAIANFKSGKLNQTGGPDVQSHFGSR